MQFVIQFLKEHSLFTRVVIFFLFIKTLIGFMAIKSDLNDKLIPVEFSFHKNFATSLNVDEREMARTAWYKIHTGKYLSDLSFGRPRFRDDTVFLSAFRPRFNVCLHVAGLALYTKLKGETIPSAKQIPESYFYSYSLCLCILKSMLFIISTFYFLGILLKIFNTTWTQIGCLLYIVFPSMFIYIGIMDILENLAMPLLVIVFAYYFINADTGKSSSLLRDFFYGILAAIACLLRPHVLFIFLLFFCFYFVYWIWQYLKNKTFCPQTRTVIISALIITGAHLPVLISNHKMFGSYFLSTQSQLEFFQGHNPYARGSWYMMIFDEHENDFKPMFAAQPDLKNFNEKEEMDFYYEQAGQWMTHNPIKEMELTARKTAIYLLPYNYLNHIFNPLNAIVYAGSIGFLLFLLLRKTIYKSLKNYLVLIIILTPVFGSYLLTIIFFVGERWRYYSEPFMILCALLFFRELTRIFDKKKFAVKSNVYG